MGELRKKVDKTIDDIWEDASCLSEGDTPHHTKEYYGAQILAAVRKHVAGAPRPGNPYNHSCSGSHTGRLMCPACIHEETVKADRRTIGESLKRETE